MRISDWSSDVCSSDLADHQHRDRGGGAGGAARVQVGSARVGAGGDVCGQCVAVAARPSPGPGGKITRECQERSEEHTSELQSLMRISYAVFCLKKKNTLIEKQPLSHTR